MNLRRDLRNKATSTDICRHAAARDIRLYSVKERLVKDCGEPIHAVSDFNVRWKCEA